MGDPEGKEKYSLSIYFFFKRRRLTHSTVALSVDLCPHRPTCEADAMHGFMTFGPFLGEAMTFGPFLAGDHATIYETF